MCIKIMARNGHQMALNQLNKCFFAYFIRGTALTCPLDDSHRGNIWCARITQLSKDFCYTLSIRVPCPLSLTFAPSSPLCTHGVLHRTPPHPPPDRTGTPAPSTTCQLCSLKYDRQDYEWWQRWWRILRSISLTHFLSVIAGYSFGFVVLCFNV